MMETATAATLAQVYGFRSGFILDDRAGTFDPKLIAKIQHRLKFVNIGDRMQEFSTVLVDFLSLVE